MIGLSGYERFGERKKLVASDLKLKTYMGEMVNPEGVGMVDVCYQGQEARLPLTVIKGNVPTLLGRDWLGSLKLSWSEMFPSRDVHRVGWVPELKILRQNFLVFLVVSLVA